MDCSLACCIQCASFQPHKRAELLRLSVFVFHIVTNNGKKGFFIMRLIRLMNKQEYDGCAVLAQGSSCDAHLGEVTRYLHVKDTVIPRPLYLPFVVFPG